MNKKIIASAAFTAFFAASAAFAGGPEIIPVEPNYFDGFFVGGTGAVHQSTISSSSSLYVPTDINVAFPVGTATTTATVLGAGTYGSYDTKGSSYDGYGGVQGGFGKVFNRQYYLGVVGFGEWGQQSATSYDNTFINNGLLFDGAAIFGDNLIIDNNTSLNSQTTTSISEDYGVAAKLGYLVAPRTLVYFKIGAVWADLSISNSANVSSAFTAVSPATGPANTTISASGNASGSSSDSETKVALLLGGGFEQFIYADIVSINVEYNYANYGSINTSTYLTGSATGTGTVAPTPPTPPPARLGATAPVTTDSGVTSEATASFKVSTILAGLNFYFGSNWF